MCQFGARVVQQLLYEIEDENFRAYVVWEPILRTDNREAAVKATALIEDPRVTHYWTDSRDVGHLFSPSIALENEPAWDVYLLYPAGNRWQAEAPKPDYFQHQLGGRLPPDQRLDGDALADRTETLLEKLSRLEMSR
ncbi:MAG: hypothetical protein V3V49_04355 [Candidatus Krumholzibacteria bacterium]